MVTDQEPRYRLVDADGNVVGSLFAESDGTLKLQEGTSGNDNELSLTTQGALEVEQADVGPAQIRSQEGSFSDGERRDAVPSVFEPQGLLVMTAAGGRPATFLLVGNADNTVLIDDPRSTFSATEGNTGTVNVFFDTGTGSYRVENNFVNNVDIMRLFFGQSSA